MTRSPRCEGTKIETKGKSHLFSVNKIKGPRFNTLLQYVITLSMPFLLEFISFYII